MCLLCIVSPGLCSAFTGFYSALPICKYVFFMWLIKRGLIPRLFREPLPAVCCRKRRSFFASIRSTLATPVVSASVVNDSQPLFQSFSASDAPSIRASLATVRVSNISATRVDSLLCIVPPGFCSAFTGSSSALPIFNYVFMWLIKRGLIPRLFREPLPAVCCTKRSFFASIRGTVATTVVSASVFNDSHPLFQSFSASVVQLVLCRESRSVRLEVLSASFT